MGAGGKLVGNIMNGKLLNGLGAGTVIGAGLNTYFGVDTYKQARADGAGQVGAVARGIGEMVVADVVGMPIYLGTMAATALPSAVVGGVNAVGQQARSMTRANMNRNIPFANATFMDTQQAYTMRQAGMQLAKSSKYNLQQTMLGNEAQFLHL